MSIISISDTSFGFLFVVCVSTETALFSFLLASCLQNLTNSRAPINILKTNINDLESILCQSQTIASRRKHRFRERPSELLKFHYNQLWLIIERWFMQLFLYNINNNLLLYIINKKYDFKLKHKGIKLDGLIDLVPVNISI